MSFKNSPVSAGNENAYDGYFVTDNWRISKKLTANLGLRIDRTHPFTLASTKIQGMYGGSGFYPSVSLGLWTKPGPRVGIAYDIWGSGKTVAKASFGRYNWDYGDTGASVYNLDNQVTTTYKWTDLNHDNLYEPGEVNFATGFVSQSGTTDPIINRKLEEPYTNQILFSVEQHVTSTISARVLYVFWKTYDNFATINPLRPYYNEYNVPVSVVVPNPNGTVTAGDPTITIYDLNPAYKGATSPTTLLNPFIGSEPVNRPPGREDYANSWEATGVKEARRTAYRAFLPCDEEPSIHRSSGAEPQRSFVRARSDMDPELPVESELRCAARYSALRGGSGDERYPGTAPGQF